MEYSEKMYLVPQNQLEMLKSGTPRENIQQVVENSLDTAIRNILLRTDLDQREKVKLYSNILTRFLTIVKQGDRESGVLTLSLTNSDAGHKDVRPNTSAKNDEVSEDVVDEVLKNVPVRSMKNSRYILDKMSKAKGLSAWNESGEFVFKGKAVPGSHMLDLLKNVTAPHQVRDDRRPLGWSEFLQAFAELNIPFSTVPNNHVRRVISSLKSRPGTIAYTPEPERPSKKTVKKRISRATTLRMDEPAFKSPTIDRRPWLEF